MNIEFTKEAEAHIYVIAKDLGISEQEVLERALGIYKEIHGKRRYAGCHTMILENDLDRYGFDIKNF